MAILPGFIYDSTANFVRPPAVGYGLRLYGATSGSVGLKPAAVAGAVDYTLPATVTFTLKTMAGVAVAGATNVAMAYVAASNGKYQGTLDSTVALTTDTSYTLEITAASGSRNGFVSLSCVTQTRTS